MGANTSICSPKKQEKWAVKPFLTELCYGKKVKVNINNKIYESVVEFSDCGIHVGHIDKNIRQKHKWKRQWETGGVWIEYDDNYIPIELNGLILLRGLNKFSNLSTDDFPYNKLIYYDDQCNLIQDDVPLDTTFVTPSQIVSINLDDDKNQPKSDIEKNTKSHAGRPMFLSKNTKSIVHSSNINDVY